MDFKSWVEGQPHGTLKRLERETGVGYTTLQRLRHGDRLDSYAIARRVSDATGGAVTIDDLCRLPSDKEVRNG